MGDIHHWWAVYVWLGLAVFVVGGARGQSVWQRCLLWVVGLDLGAICTAGSIHRRHRSSPDRQGRAPCILAADPVARTFYGLANSRHNRPHDTGTLRGWWRPDHIVFPWVDLAMGKDSSNAHRSRQNGI